MQQRVRFGETTGEILGGLALTALGVVWAVTSIDYGIVSDTRLAPGAVPFTAGALLALCGLALAVRGIVVSLRTGESLLHRVATTSGEDESTDVDSSSPDAAATSPLQLASAFLRKNPVLSVYLIVVLAMALMSLVGFAVAFALAIFAIMLLVERQRIMLSAIVAVATAAAGYVLFEVVFNLPLPAPFFL